jgi:class 3 adenylate cyclase
MMAVFASPDHALKALSEGRDRLKKVKADGYKPKIRAGIHVGKPRKVGKDYFGVDVNIAARVADSAGPGELMVSGQALDELGAGVTTQKRDLLDAKGVPEDFLVYAVTAA